MQALSRQSSEASSLPIPVNGRVLKWPERKEPDCESAKPA